MQLTSCLVHLANFDDFVNLILVKGNAKKEEVFLLVVWVSQIVQSISVHQAFGHASLALFANATFGFGLG